MNLVILPGIYSVARLNPTEEIPSSLYQSDFFSITRTSDELSIVCEEKRLEGLKQEGGWSIIKVDDKLDFSLTGILNSLTHPLSLAKISLFALSTYDTDFIMVKTEKLDQAKAVLEQHKFTFA